MSATESGQRCIGDWLVDPQPLGQGSFAVVWKATHRATSCPAAIKEINLTKLNSRLRQSLESEISVLSRISHQNVVQLYEVLETHGKMFLIMEYCSGGDLSQYFKSKGKISEKDIRYLMQDLAAGLREMWTHHLVHRDLKPQNLLLATPATTTDTATNTLPPPPTLKIADFGFARALGPHLMAETLCGSPLYMAPEILLSQKYDAKADLWSVGTILYEALAGRPPYTGGNQVALIRNIRDREARLPPEVATGLSQECRALVYALLKRNVADRLTFEEFFDHPFLLASAKASGRDAGNSGDNLSKEKRRGSTQYPQQIVGFEDSGGVVNDAASAASFSEIAATTATVVTRAAAPEAAPVSQLTEQFKPRLVSMRRPIQTQRPPLPVVQNQRGLNGVPGAGDGIGGKEEYEDDDDYVLVSARNSTTKAAPILAATPPVQESGVPRSADTITRKPAVKTAAAPQEAFLLHSQSQQKENKRRINEDLSGISSSHGDQHQRHHHTGAVVFDAVPWQAASRRSFLRTMAGILNTLGTELEKKNPLNSKSKTLQTEILAQQLSFYIASLQLYDLVLSGGGTSATGRKEPSTNDAAEEDTLAELYTSDSNSDVHHDHQKHSMHSSNLGSAESSGNTISGSHGGRSEDAGVALHEEASAVLHRAEFTAAALKKEMNTTSDITKHDSNSNTTFLPNPWQACHSAALLWAEEAASEELLGNYIRSEKLYCRAGTVLHFLSAEAGAISPTSEKYGRKTGNVATGEGEGVGVVDTTPAFKLDTVDEVKLRRCASAAAVRWAVCSSLAGKEAQEENG
ncbi:hypothetical protein Ndes2437B_g08473 [Nannochloris sp. 'desiccata']